jgi:hypothetical protein
MSTLAQQQEMLLNALFEWPAPSIVKHPEQTDWLQAVDPRSLGLKAYQANAHGLAQRALLAVYPVVAEIIGAEGFAQLACAFWHAHPPARGDLAQWGEFLPQFLDGSPQVQETPYLSDVARVEWALHGAATASNGVTDTPSLARLTEEDPAELSFELSPGFCTFQSDWPVASILSAHREGTPAWAEVGSQLRQRLGQSVVIWRQGLRPCVRQALPDEPLYLQALSTGRSIAQALDEAPALDFSAWLPLAFQSGLILAVVPRTKPVKSL